MINKKVSKKDKEFMENFISLSFEKRELQFALKENKKDVIIKKDLEKVNKKINSFLPRYSILFENDLEVLHKIFNKVSKKEKLLIIDSNFENFLEWVFKELYEKKIIDKNTFDELNKWLIKLEIKLINVGPLIGQHV